MRPIVLLLPIVAIGIAACAAGPESKHGPVPAVQRVQAIDLGLASTTRRLGNLQRSVLGTPKELARAGKLTKHADLLAPIGKRIARLPTAAAALAHGELARRPKLPAGIVPDDFARDLADNLATTVELLGGAHRPLAEIDDQRHRTSPTDDRPEATWWQRLRRRLRL